MHLLFVLEMQATATQQEAWIHIEGHAMTILVEMPQGSIVYALKEAELNWSPADTILKCGENLVQPDARLSDVNGGASAADPLVLS